MEITIQLPSAGQRMFQDTRRYASPGCPMCGSQKPCLSSLFNEAEIDFYRKIVTGRRRVDRDAILYREHEILSTLCGSVWPIQINETKFYRRVVCSPVLHGGRIDWARRYRNRTASLQADSIGKQRGLRNIIRSDNKNDGDTSATSGPFFTIYERSPQRSRRSFVRTVENNLDERFANFLIEIGEKYERLGIQETPSVWP